MNSAYENVKFDRETSVLDPDLKVLARLVDAYMQAGVVQEPYDRGGRDHSVFSKG
jgi:hypothetical protein